MFEKLVKMYLCLEIGVPVWTDERTIEEVAPSVVNRFSVEEVCIGL